MGFTGRRQQPGWGTMMGRQFGMGLLNLAPQLASSVLTSGIRDHFRKMEEAREYEREKEKWARDDEAARKAREEQYGFLRGMEKSRQEQKQIGEVTRAMADYPEEQAKYAGAPRTYQSPATKMTGEAMKGIVPQMVSAGVGAMTALPFTGREPVGAEPPEAKPTSPLEKKMMLATSRAKEMGIPSMPVRPQTEAQWKPPQRLGVTPGVQPSALAGAGTAAMLGKAFEPEGTLEAGAREAGIAMRGRQKPESTMTAAQKNARDTFVQRRKSEERWFQLKKIAERGNISMQQKKYVIKEMRALQQQIHELRRQEHDYAIAGMIPSEVEMPEVGGAPQFKVGKGLNVETIQPDPTEGMSETQRRAYNHYRNKGESPERAAAAARNLFD